ncbi:MAG: c-type cytochrome domain-containing protein [Planctomycetota bacterium]
MVCLVLALPALGAASAVLAQEPASTRFEADVAPLLQRHCVRCHGPDKQKGDLRLDRRAALFPADGDAWTVRPGDPGSSELLRRVRLPAADDEVMPQDGDPLPPDAVLRLETWIGAGAVWPDSGDAWFEAAARAATPRRLSFELPPRGDAEDAQIEATLAALRARGLSAHRLAEDEAAVAVRAPRRRDAFTDGDVAALRALAPVLVWLDLSGTGITDAAAPGLAALPQLRRLQCADTALGDAAFGALGALRRLEVLNATGTRLGDDGLRSLGELPALRRVYATGTAVSAAAVAGLQAARAGLRVDRGDAPERRLQAARAEVADAGAAAANATCPVSGKPVTPGNELLHDGLRLGFCCADCRATFAADPARFAGALADLRRSPGTGTKKP